MKKKLLLPLGICIMAFTSLALIPANYPPLPDIVENISQTKDYTFRIHAMSANTIELAHTNARKPIFLNLKLAGSWETKRPSLYLTSIGQKAKMRSGNSSKANPRGFGRFMKDNNGTPVRSYLFRNTVVKGRSGKRFMQMVFKGPDMPMVHTMILPQTLSFPPHVANNFDQGNLSLKKGTYRLDPDLNGFNIELE